jgi:hypothetical protein
MRSWFPPFAARSHLCVERWKLFHEMLPLAVFPFWENLVKPP